MWFIFRLMISFISRLLNENLMLTEPVELSSMKRHSEGTFSNDYSKYLETRRAQDFVQWLKNSKRNGWVHPGWVTHLKVYNWNLIEIFRLFNITGIITFYSNYISSSEDFPPNACVFTGVCSDAMQTALTPATWVPTCRTRQPRSLCPGLRPAEAEESEGQPEHPNHAMTHTDSICYYMVQPVPVFSWSCN